MKRFLSVFLILTLIALLFVGCSETEKLSVGTDNDKLVGAWILINETDGFGRLIRYWEFRSDDTVMMYDFVKTAESDTVNHQLYEEMPLEDTFKTYYIEDTTKIEKYAYSYIDGHGLEYRKSENDVVAITEKEGWHFNFLNKNKFYLTTETFEYHGYRLKTSLLNN